MAAALRWEGTANPRPTSSAENDAQGIRRALESTILDEKIAAKRQRTDSAPAEKVAPARPKVQRSTSSGSVSLTIDKKKREATQRAFLQALEPHIMESEIPKVKELCATIDEHLSFFFASNPQGYIDQARSIRFNLKDAHNLRFRTGVLANLTGCTTFSPEKLPKMSADDMASSEKLKQRETLRKEAAEEIQTDWAVRHGQLQASGTFWCGKCKKNKTTYFQMQTRSSDEPMQLLLRVLIATIDGNFVEQTANPDEHGANGHEVADKNTMLKLLSAIVCSSVLDCGSLDHRPSHDPIFSPL
eukprot:CAMPEP_0204312570 /NCGR_PEP_ID=MMETSP0469-20131031/3057_1 /ASSEMBLY_ACC=CAM_ASM_000384 /TAXON_ID=2969 /ORGANISM="Oxyrrhis marina" /LENGTH=300 /DNA_ID=CAMNT_0051292723 /DNA_START=1 /DNA_END=904 /DNA_ORIENTATION=+